MKRPGNLLIGGPAILAAQRRGHPLWSTAGSAACDLASQQLLQAGDELGRAQRTSVGFGTAQVAKVLVRVHV
jgi:hypothetical protein